MEPKKNPKINEDRKSLLFRLIGLNVAVLLVVVAFTWSTYERAEFELEADLYFDEEEEMADVTKQQEIPPPPPPPEIEVVEDDVEIDEDQPDLDEREFDDDLDDITFPDEPDEHVDEQEIFTVVEDEPSFPGGMGELQQYLRDNIQYPRVAREAGRQGRVIVTFIVEPDGSISNIEVREGMGISEDLDEEAKRVVSEMPRWEPGKQRDQPVRVRVNLPIRFRLH